MANHAYFDKPPVLKIWGEEYALSGLYRIDNMVREPRMPGRSWTMVQSVIVGHGVPHVVSTYSDIGSIDGPDNSKGAIWSDAKPSGRGPRSVAFWVGAWRERWRSFLWEWLWLMIAFWTGAVLID